MNFSSAAVLVVAFLAPLGTFAQDASGLATTIEAVRFHPLARQARIQGDVRLGSGPDGVTVINGHPLLAQEAVSSLKALGKLSELEIEAIYHFVLAPSTFRIATRVEKKGNRFERVIRHLFLMKTEEVVEYTECIENPFYPKNRIEITENRVEVWIYDSIPCLQTSTSQIALN
jgi:hypothetical protein